MALFVPLKPTRWDLFRFLLVFTLRPLGVAAFFFPVFVLEKNLRSEAERVKQSRTGKSKPNKCQTLKLKL